VRAATDARPARIPARRACRRPGPAARARRDLRTRLRRGVLLLVALPLGAAAEEPLILPPAGEPPARVEREELLREEERKRIDFYAGSSVVSKYVARGLVFLDEPSLQPWLEVDVAFLHFLAPGTRPPLADRISAFAGLWGNVSLSGRDDGLARTGRAAVLRDWYEADAYAGLRFLIADHVSTSLRYNYYSSPSGSFADIHEIDWRVLMDDRPVWTRLGVLEDVGLFPGLRIAKEIVDQGGPENWYFQPSLTPTWRIQGLPVPVTVEVPLILGFGADGQYLGVDGDEHGFGFFQTGIAVAADLDLLPERAGAITVSLAFDYIRLSDSDLGLGGDPDQTVVRGGLSYAY